MYKNEYIDLALPSGTLWKRENEGVMEMSEGEANSESCNLFFTKEEIETKFDTNLLPTLAQFEELIENTMSEVYAEGVVYFKSKINGNAISFVFKGDCGCYYIKDSEKALCVYRDGRAAIKKSEEKSYSVRVVK